MKLFKCAHCGQLVTFESYFCLQCHSSLGFYPAEMAMISLESTPDPVMFKERKKQGKKKERLFRYCANKQYNVCNWILPEHNNDAYCTACNLNRTIPDLAPPDHWDKWYRVEIAKHRLVYSLMRLGLPVTSKFIDPVHGLAFDFVTARGHFGIQPLLTGHEEGLITLNIDEADDVAREMSRNQMGEVYRTILGHFRHEIGHYYWDRLVRNTEALVPFRELFGNETIDYGMALQQYHNSGTVMNWSDQYISAYASAHPWEDWAETWAHYLHIVDTLETAFSYGVKLKPLLSEKKHRVAVAMDKDPYLIHRFGDLLERWVPLTLMMNSLNRSMGMKDSYPFVISEAVKTKLKFVHQLIHRNAGGTAR